MMKRQLVFLFAVLCGAGQAQQPIGSVAVQDVTVAGNLAVNNGRAVLVGSTTVTAKDHTADVKLNRGGTVRVCATSGLHITAGKSTAGAEPLMLSLDRGAIEVQMAATTSDAIMTPDLRFGIRSDGPLDLRLRVTGNGDTCVENRGANAPILNIADPFGESAYDLKPGQHVLFEHGSLKEVVDNESSPCGCPPNPVNEGVSLADAAIAPGAGQTAAAKSAAEQHPFPAAISDGLAPATAAPQAPPGVVHTQIGTTLSYSAGEDEKVGTPATSSPAAKQPVIGEDADKAQQAATIAKPATPEPAEAPIQQTSAASPPPAHSSDLAHWIGHLFKRMFGRH